MAFAPPRSTARIAGHPIHPMLVMFPVVLFIGTFAADLLWWGTENLFWATLGLFSLGLGIVTALVAAVFGLIDYFGDPRIRALPAATHHAAGNILLVALQVANFFQRWQGGPADIVPWGVTLSGIAFLILGYSGWKGATLVYAHAVGVDPAQGAVERDSPQAAHQAIDLGNRPGQG